MLSHRVRARLRSIPMPRLRRFILGLYLTVAAADAAGWLSAFFEKMSSLSCFLFVQLIRTTSRRLQQSESSREQNGFVVVIIQSIEMDKCLHYPGSGFTQILRSALRRATNRCETSWQAGHLR